ncbi:MAG TPA: ankyrin repeat domain-containing protein [Rickettsia endosymbiont of Degeeriella rufa]|nr:ankyrin repeat domain-containing protein [Rickettsia endosymbiont of Degeeriella rufa]
MELLYAARNGIVKAYELLIKANPNFLDTIDDKGYTEQHYAAQNGNFEIFELIISRKPELLKVVDKYNNTVLHLAANSRQTKICKLLIEYPDLVNAINNYVNTALHTATNIHYGNMRSVNIQIYKLLIDKNPQLIDIKNKDGSTALHLVAKSSTNCSLGDICSKICKLFIDKNPKIINAIDN